MPHDRLPERSHRHLAAKLALIFGVLAVLLPSVAVGASAIAIQAEKLRRLESEIAGHNARFTAASGAFQSAQSQLATVNGRIKANTLALNKALAEQAAAQKVLSGRLSAVYRQPEPTNLEVLLRSESVSSALARLDFVKRVQSGDVKVVQTIERTRDRIKAARVELDKDKKAASAHLAESKARLAEIASIRAARLRVLVATRTQLAAMIVAEQNAARQRALQAAQQRVVRQIATNNGGGNARGNGGAARPGAAGPAAPVPVAAPTPVAAAPSGDIAAALRKIAACESGGSPSAVSPSGTYRGKYQFDVGTWQSMGGTGDPAAASEAEQDQRAANLYRQRGASPWPVCGR